MSDIAMSGRMENDKDATGVICRSRLVCLLECGTLFYRYHFYFDKRTGRERGNLYT